jgi:hypothetical protein
VKNEAEARFFDEIKGELKGAILANIENRKTPCEMSIIYNDLRQGNWPDTVPTHFPAFAALELANENLLWMIPVPEGDPEAEYLLFGLPTMEKPADPVDYLGLQWMGSDDLGWGLIPKMFEDPR